MSIADGPYGHDNPAFESPSRKISACSDHADIGPVRKKSILHKQNSELDFTGIKGKRILTIKLVLWPSYRHERKNKWIVKFTKLKIFNIIASRLTYIILDSRVHVTRVGLTPSVGGYVL